MVRDITASCEGGSIRLSWEWTDKNIETVKIFYKRDEIVDGEGTLFSEEIAPVPGEKRGRAARPYVGERGLYTFTFSPKMAEDPEKNKVSFRGVMLGAPVRVPWRISREKGNAVIRFGNFEGKIPSGVAWVENDMRKYQLDYELKSDSVLLFPTAIDGAKVFLYAREPYNKLYHFYKEFFE